MKEFAYTAERHRGRSLRWGVRFNQFCVKTSAKKCKTPRVLHTPSNPNSSTSQHLPIRHLCKIQQFCTGERSFTKTAQNRMKTPCPTNPRLFPTHFPLLVFLHIKHHQSNIRHPTRASIPQVLLCRLFRIFSQQELCRGPMT